MFYVILSPFLHNCAWDLRLGCDLPGRRSIEAETQTQHSTTDVETQTQYSTAEAETQTEQKVFASARGALSEEKTQALVQELLKLSRVTCWLEQAEASEQPQKLSKLKSLVEPLAKEVRQMPPGSLKTLASRVMTSAVKGILKVEKGQEGPWAALGAKIKKAEDFCRLDKNYGQREWLWIQTMLRPDSIATEAECAKEWTCKLSRIYEHQKHLRSQFVEAEVELTSIVKEEIGPVDLQMRVFLLFKEISESMVKTKKAIEAQEKEMGAFGKKFPKFQKAKEEITDQNHKNGMQK